MNRLSNKPTGRVGLKGKARIQKKYALKSYNIDFKRAVLVYWEQATMENPSKFCPEMKLKDLEIKRKLLYGWTKKKEDLESTATGLDF